MMQPNKQRKAAAQQLLANLKALYQSLAVTEKEAIQIAILTHAHEQA